jgi:hypothetical protein
MVAEACSRRGVRRWKRLLTVYHALHVALLGYYAWARTWYGASGVFKPTDYLPEIGMTREKEVFVMALLWLWRMWFRCGTIEEFADSLLLTGKVACGALLVMFGGMTEGLRFGLLWLLVMLLVPRPDYRGLGSVEALSPASLASKVGPCDERLDELRPKEAVKASYSRALAAKEARKAGLGCQATFGAGGSLAPSDSSVQWVGEGDAGDDSLEGLVPWMVFVEASWSERCSQLSPLVADLSDQFRGSVRFGRIDVARWPDAAKALRVDASSSSSSQIPSFILFRGGREALRVPTVESKEKFTGGVVYDEPGLIVALGLGELATKAAGRRVSTGSSSSE